MLKIYSDRNFGVEIELNSFDGESRAKDIKPTGCEYIANLVNNVIKNRVEIKAYGHTHWNKSRGCWIVKPDASCGMEVCSPICKGWLGLRDICNVVEALGSDEKISADERCSMHVHVDVGDLYATQLYSLIMWWVKCEHIFMDLTTSDRKLNKFCQFIGLWDWFQPDSDIPYKELIKLLGLYKYTSLNTYHMFHGNRSTIEFRIAGSEACKDPYLAKMWIRFFLHFVNMAKFTKCPSNYETGNSMTGWAWLEPTYVFNFLGFDGTQELSGGVLQLRNWFYSRLLKNTLTNIKGIFSKEIKQHTMAQLKQQILKIGNFKNSVDKDAVYGDKYRF